MAPAMSAEVRRIFEQAPFIAELGIELESLGQGECTTALVIQPRHLQQDGYVHAGVQATVADHTAGAAAATLIREGQMVLTAEFRISLLRAARGDRLRCTARVLKPGRLLTVVESEVFCIAAGVAQLVSKASVTLAVVDGRGS